MSPPTPDPDPDPEPEPEPTTTNLSIYSVSPNTSSANDYYVLPEDGDGSTLHRFTDYGEDYELTSGTTVFLAYRSTSLSSSVEFTVPTVGVVSQTTYVKKGSYYYRGINITPTGNYYLVGVERTSLSKGDDVDN